MLIGEVGLRPAELGVTLGASDPAASHAGGFEPISKLALGAWRFTPQFPELVAVNAAGDAKTTTHWGAYILGEQTLYRVPDSNRNSDGLRSLRRYRRQDQQHRLFGQRRYRLAGRVRWP
jgi:hypothetical protein